MHHIFYGAGIQRGLMGSFGLGSFVRLQSRCQVGLQICESLGQRICLHELLRGLESSFWSLAGRPRFLYTWPSPQNCESLLSCSECPYSRTAEFPKSNLYKRKGGRKLNVRIIKIQRSYTASLSSILFGIEARHHLMWEETARLRVLGARNPWVPSWRLATICTIFKTWEN